MRPLTKSLVPKLEGKLFNMVDRTIYNNQEYQMHNNQGYLEYIYIYIELKLPHSHTHTTHQTMKKITNQIYKW